MAELRAAWWADRALRGLRVQLSQASLRNLWLLPPSELPESGLRGVTIVLRLRRASCLEGALVRQSWLAAHGVRRDVVIGVGSPGRDFAAHAWLDGDRDPLAAQYTELTRVAP